MPRLGRTAIWPGWGVLLAGAALLAQEPVTVLEVDFESPTAPALVRLAGPGPVPLTTTPDEVLAGRQSLKADSRRSAQRWNEYLHSPAGLFAAREAYLVTLEYRLLTAETRAYALFRRRGATDRVVGWQNLTGAPGERRSASLSLWTAAQGDWALVLGLDGHGAIAIDQVVIRTDPANRIPEVKLPEPQRTWTSPGGVTWHVDSQAGDDAADGRSPATAWQSLAKVNTGTFAPGDRVLLKAGSAWPGYLAPGGQGSAAAPIVIDRYGDGPAPQIDAQGQWLAALYLLNVAHLEVHGLDLANRAKVRIPRLTGVTVRLQSHGEAVGIRLRGLTIHDVFGSNVKRDGGGAGLAIVRDDPRGEPPRSVYRDLVIEGCELTRCDRNGITFGGPWSRDQWLPNTGVVIRGNTLLDLGGDGIVPAGCDGALVEYNVVRGARRRAQDAAAGIWPWSCDHTLVQFNEVSGVKGTVDGQGFDSDWNCRGTIFQYNYSHDNEGGFMLLCSNGATKPPWNIGCQDTIVRYNISQNDRTRIFHISGPVERSLIHNNVIYVGEGLDVKLVLGGNWGGPWPTDTRFVNNLVVAAGRLSLDLGGMARTVWERNLFWGNLTPPAGPGNLVADPGLLRPGTGGDGLASLTGYQLGANSPCRAAGLAVSPSGGRDFWGHPLPDGALSIGAHEPAAR